jgi:putative exosortase-associated protein (TIGR04073 family)
MRNLHCTGLALAAGASLGLGVASSAGAQTFTAAEKFNRGVAAMATGFLELPGNMMLETRERGPEYGMTVGVAKGLGGIVVRELVGVYELLSSPFAVPDGYRPILRPVYPWGYFDETEMAARDAEQRPAIAASHEEL